MTTMLPPRPTDTNETELGFARRSMCPWLSPRLLLATASRVIISGLLGAYNDKREIMAALPAQPPEDLRAPAELWFDYVSDLGDGFDATYTVASLLARPVLELAGTGTGAETGARASAKGGPALPRGRMLIMGGDQCYPTPSISGYQDKLIGPYRAALPGVTGPESAQPRLYVVPGNHDWYDGLTSFMKVFCQGANIGGWRTKQSRSYFAVRLPHRWWLLGIDIQFDSYIDDPQRRYFLDVAAAMKPGDAVILCSAKPSWLHADDPRCGSYAVLDYFERTVISPSGARIHVWIAGDQHHYSRFSPADGSGQRITAGGGGAYLTPTHHLPLRIEPAVPATRVMAAEPAAALELRQVYPSPADSRRLGLGIMRLPVLAPGLAVLLGAVQLLIAIVIGGATAQGGRGVTGRFGTVAAGLRAGGFTDLATNLVNSFLGLVVGLGVLAAGVALTHRGWTPRGLVAGLGHGCAQLAVALGVIAGVVALSRPLAGDWLLALAAPLIVIVGGTAATLLLALYLWLADGLLGLNTNELFAAQHIQHRKNFLRMRIDAEGVLTIYPIGIPTVEKRWRLVPDGPRDAPWLVPTGDGPAPFLLEEPIRVPGAAPHGEPRSPGRPAEPAYQADRR